MSIWDYDEEWETSEDRYLRPGIYIIVRLSIDREVTCLKPNRVELIIVRIWIMLQGVDSYLIWFALIFVKLHDNNVIHFAQNKLSSFEFRLHWDWGYVTYNTFVHTGGVNQVGGRVGLSWDTNQHAKKKKKKKKEIKVENKRTSIQVSSDNKHHRFMLNIMRKNEKFLIDLCRDILHTSIFMRQDLDSFLKLATCDAMDFSCSMLSAKVFPCGKPFRFFSGNY